jgi:NAD-dependent deacetylase
MHKKVVVFTGAGISAESGLKTFRASDGLWEEHHIEDVATPEAFARNPALVLEFYNLRRKQVMAAQPNAAHVAIAGLQNDFDVQVITQNIDDLHERAGSNNVIHLHGEIMKARSSRNETEFYPIQNGEINLGDTCKNGGQLRPHVVWFGEAVPMMERATIVTQQADIFIVIGTSLSVYPAAGLLHAAAPQIPKFLVDPGDFDLREYRNLHHIKQNAVAGMEELQDRLGEYQHEKRP